MIRITVYAFINLMIACSLFLMPVFIATESFGDQIFLKNGSVEQSDRIWESDKYIHFILKGTQGVEIRYAKDIVARIERQNPGDATSSTNKVMSVEAAPEPIVDVAQNRAPKNSPATNTGPVATQGLSHAVHGKLAKENKGLLFYDPRRPMRYWVMRNSKHKELAPALDTMARLYNRSVEWVEIHMGQDNELGKIHRNLAIQFQNETAGRGASAPLKPDAKNIEVPSENGDSQRNHETKRPGPHKPSISPGNVAGLRFYDPRRVEKYWSGRMTRHHTLKDALNALAEQYAVTLSWIETHMGDSNDLASIHRNIQKNLK